MDTVEKRGGMHPYRRLAWNDDQHEASHYEEYHEETTNPTQYVRDLVGDERHAWSLGQEEPKKPANDESKVKDDPPHPYRQEAWTNEQNSFSHPTEFPAETANPSGY